MIYPDEALHLTDAERQLATAMEEAIDIEIRGHDFILFPNISYRLMNGIPLRVCWVLVSRYRAAGWHAQIIWNHHGAWIVIAP